MLYFENDYCEGAHKAILKRLMETNMEKVPGYGLDPYCDQAKEKIKTACGCPDGEVYFLVGGTQTNAVVIASMLNRYEGVVSAVTGHVNAHEAGAIEFTGHKVLPLPQKDGKISAASERLPQNLLCRWQLRSHGFSGNGLYFSSYRIWHSLYQTGAG